MQHTFPFDTAVFRRAHGRLIRVRLTYMVAMKALLLRVGIDKGCGGTLAPIFDDGSFEFVPIPESVPAPGASTYNDRIGRKGKRLSAYVPSSIKNAPKVKGKRKKGGKTPPRRLQRAPSP